MSRRSRTTWWSSAAIGPGWRWPAAWPGSASASPSWNGIASAASALNTGCVPSKALLAAASRAQAVRESGRYGIHVEATRIDWAGVRAHVDGAIAAVALHDSAERFAAWSVEVVRGHARLAGRHEVDVGSRRLSAPRLVLATGSQPAIPPIEDLADVPTLTHETLFALDALPARLLILGGGPVGVEMAQAFWRLGS